MIKLKRNIRCLWLVLLLLEAGTVFGQVGIGNPAPDTASVLDLTNPAAKGLVLPPATSAASFSNSSSLGMTYFSGDHIYYKRSDGYNALTPWKYRFAGNSTENVYYNSGGNIGIGNTNITTSPDAPLQIATDVPVSLSNHGSFMIGASTGPNLILNTGELQARNNGIGAPLVLNENGGDISLGSAVAPVDVNVSDRVQHLDQPTGNYYDLVPIGTIVMWQGGTTNIPTGWILCDGGTYMASDNSGMVNSPDLQGMFVVSYGVSGNSTYAEHDVGGEDLVTLQAANNPAHIHHISLSTLPGGSHSHSMRGSYRTHDGDGGGGDDAMSDGGSRQTSTNGNHAHSLNGNTQSTGGTAHENRPEYHALVYIMKL